MCIAVPGEVKEIKKDSALTMGKVDFGGISKDICLEWVPEVKLGDFVIVHAGFAINIMDSEEALSTIELMEKAASDPDSFQHWESTREQNE